MYSHEIGSSVLKKSSGETAGVRCGWGIKILESCVVRALWTLGERSILELFSTSAPGSIMFGNVRFKPRLGGTCV